MLIKELMKLSEATDKTVDFKSKVFHTLDQSIKDGYELQDYTVDNIVTGIVDYDSEMEKIPKDKLKSYIKQWVDKKYPNRDEDNLID